MILRCLSCARPPRHPHPGAFAAPALACERGTGVFGTLRAAARVFIFQALSAWTVLESTGQTEQLASDFQGWLRRILEGEEPHVRRVSSVKVSFPKH